MAVNAKIESCRLEMLTQQEANRVRTQCGGVQWKHDKLTFKKQKCEKAQNTNTSRMLMLAVKFF